MRRSRRPTGLLGWLDRLGDWAAYVVIGFFIVIAGIAIALELINQ